MNGNGTGEIGEAASPGKCPTVGQDGPGRHPATARMKWSRDMNITVMECYYLSKPVDESGRPVIGYRQRMHAVWKKEVYQRKRSRDYVIRLGRSEKMPSLLPSSWMKSGEE